MAEDTIFALSSGQPPAAIAIVRISGRQASEVVRKFAGHLPSPRRATLVALRNAAGELLDRALVVWFPGDNSVTGEPLAEFHLHGGRATILAVVDALAGVPGCRVAEPGEFTRRGLINGRLDLVQAEALADLLAAETDGQRRSALRNAEGGLGRLVDDWRARLLALSALVEASIEFAEEHDDVVDEPDIAPEASVLVSEMRAACAAPPAERLRDGVRVVIGGPPNAGKSTLLNALCGRDVAITSQIPGTTRDLIEVPIVMSGRACILVDTAGLRETDDTVEQAGVERALRTLKNADMLIWLGDRPACPDPDRAIIVQAQADVPGRTYSENGSLLVSARTGMGLSELKTEIVVRCDRLLPVADSVTLNQRQQQAVSDALKELATSVEEADILFQAEHLKRAWNALGRVTGHVGHEAMLDTIFSRFCVGK